MHGHYLTESRKRHQAAADFKNNSNPCLNDNRSHHNNQQSRIEIALPPHLDRHLDQPFSSAASLEVDRWLNYLALEGVTA